MVWIGLIGAALAAPTADAVWHGWLSETITSSCSQSWDVSTYDNRATLQLSGERATMTVETRYTGTISGWRDPEATHSARDLRCKWAGTAVVSEAGVTLQLQAIEATDYICEMPRDAGLTLVCSEGTQEMLVCRWSGESFVVVPWWLQRMDELWLSGQAPTAPLQMHHDGGLIVGELEAPPRSDGE